MINKKIYLGLFILFSFFLTSCTNGNIEKSPDTVDKNLNQIMAAKTRFAISKTSAPVFNTYDLDIIFGGSDGFLKYDRFGEIDELVFVALPNTFFQIQRQIRKPTRLGKDTIYYKVTTPDYEGSQSLWIDGRFLDLRDIRPQAKREHASASKTLITLRLLEGAPYTWHGSSLYGVQKLLQYYPPLSDLTPREKDDWILKGFDSLGMLYYASNGAIPIGMESLGDLGKAVYVDLSKVVVSGDNDDPNSIRLKKAKSLLSELEPLDIIQMNDRIWIVLDQSDVIESRYRSKFDGGVKISPLLDTLYGLLEKGVYVKNPFEELEDPLSKAFFIRRYADTGTLSTDQLTVTNDTVIDETLPDPVLFTVKDGAKSESSD